MFKKEVEKLRETTLKDLREERDATLEAKDLDKAVALREAIKAFESAKESGLSSKEEVVSKRKIKKCIPRTAVKFNGHHYAVVTERMTPRGAALYAESVGAHLVRIETAEQNQSVMKLTQNFESGGPNGGFWIDDSDAIIEGKWIYSDGSPLVFVTAAGVFYNSEGRDHFVEIRKDGTWNDDLLRRQASVIEWDN